MERESQNRLPQAVRLALRVTGLLGELGIPYLIGGSMASILHGEARLTNHIDLVADLHEAHVAPLVIALAEEFHADEHAMRRAMRERSSFNLIYLPTMFKVDVFVLRDDAWAHEQIRRSEAKPLLAGDDATIRKVASAETMVLQKLLWFRKGGEVSDRQWRDVQGMLKVQAVRIDVEYLRQWAAKLQISDLLERALLAAGIS